MMRPRGGYFHVESSASTDVREDGSLCCVELICEDWRVVNEAGYLKITFLTTRNICLVWTCHREIIEIRDDIE